jgi:hypothetical protein
MLRLPRHALVWIRRNSHQQLAIKNALPTRQVSNALDISQAQARVIWQIGEVAHDQNVAGRDASDQKRLDADDAL